MKTLIAAFALATFVLFIGSANAALRADPDEKRNAGRYEGLPLAEWYRQVSQYCAPQGSDEPQNSRAHKIYCQLPSEGSWPDAHRIGEVR
jgi:hypothetical protein